MIKIHERYQSPLFIVAVGLQALDLLTFALAIPHLGIQAESNPLMASLYGNLGLFGVTLMKLFLIAFLTLILPRLHTLDRVALIATGAIGLLGTTTNLLSWWIVTQ